MSTVRSFELRPESAELLVPSSHQFAWPMRKAPRGNPHVVRASLDPWLTDLGTVRRSLVDLVRIATAAYCADRVTPRGRRFTRAFDLAVHSTDISAWSAASIGEVALLLRRLTGDEWKITLAPEQTDAPPVQPSLTPGLFDCVALLSGGLDSFCGAVLAQPDRGKRLYIGHWNNSTTKGSQTAARLWFDSAYERRLAYEQVFLTQGGKTRDPTTRTRSLLFLVLAAAHANAYGAHIVEVPENGYTSLNPPLAPWRAGALSTRSTHPWTFHLFNGLLAALDIDVTVVNPYQALTKGDFVAYAARAAEDAGVAGFAEAAAATISCSKLDGRVYRKGNAHRNCGLCFSCLVRRAAFATGGIPDATEYLADTLPRLQRNRLLRRRRADDQDLTYAIEHLPLSEDDLEGPFPPGFDLAHAADICNQSLRDIAAVRASPRPRRRPTRRPPLTTPTRPRRPVVPPPRLL